MPTVTIKVDGQVDGWVEGTLYSWWLFLLGKTAKLSRNHKQNDVDLL